MSYLIDHGIPSLVAAIAYMALGFIWYMPQVFGRPWMKFSFGTTEMSAEHKKGMGKAMLGSFIAALIAACVLRGILFIMGVTTAGVGAQYALYLAIGFIATVMLTDALYSHKKFGLLLITAGYHMTAFVIMGAILGAWPA